MALSRSEIEILIKARNEAQGAFDNLSKQVSSVTGSATQATKAIEGTGRATREAGNSGQAASVAFGLLVERLARGLVGAFGDTIREANKLDSGLIGLSSVAKAFNQDVGAAQAAAKKLAADGLMSVGDAATGLKNLLAAGFGLDQAVTLMTRFKDSAAFGRQGALSFGEAIRGATEGIKNGNSILVDNAGVTKNLSQMLTEAGYSAQDLSKAGSDVNVRMAIFNGILKETNPQLGDAAKYADTAAGGQAKWNSQIEIAQAKIGKALQPALTSLLAALTPLVQTLGTMAPVLVPLGAAIGAVVIPLAAMRAAAALGIPSMTALGTSITGAIAAAGNQAAFGRTATAITGVGEAAKTASVGVGMLQRAVLVFAAFEVGQGIGKLATQVQELGKESDSTGGKIAAAFMKYTGIGAVADSIQGITEAVVTAADGTASLSEQMDVIQKASEQAGRQIISYSEAMSILAAKTPPAEVAMRNFWATLTKAPNLTPTLAQGEALMAQFDKIGGAAKASADRVDGWNSELNRVANAGGLATLRKELDAGILTTKELSVQFGIGEDAIKFYEKKLKDAGEAAKAHTKTQEEAKKKADDLRKANEDLADSLFDLGVVTTATGQKALKDLIAPLSQAGSTSTPAFQQALVDLLPKLEELAKKAAASGVQVDGLAAAMDRSKKAAEDQVAPMIAWENSLPTLALEDLITGTQTWTAEQEWAGVQAMNTADAFKFFGISTRKELQDTAAAAERHYRSIVAAVGANAPEAVRAYRGMIDAQKAATQEIPSLWQSDIFPKVKGVIGTLTDAINGSFAQMLLGAKGFKAGFVDIWESIKSAIGNILNSILSTFLNTFLKGIMGALSGQKGAISGAFSSLFGGTGGAGGILGGLFGGMGGVPGAAGSLIGPEAGTGAGLLAGGGGGGLLAGLGGGLMAGGAGFGIGQLFQSLFGGAGAKAGAGGALGGAATGALIGSIMPGIGTLIGGVLGGAAGLFGGLFGQSAGMKTNDVRDQFIGQFGESGTGQGSGFLNLASELAKLSTASGGGEGGGTLFKNLIGAKTLADLEKAVTAVTLALNGEEYAAINAKTATDDMADADVAATNAADERAIQLEDEQQKLQDRYATAKEALETHFSEIRATIQGQIDSLSSEMSGLQNSIANEAPEEVMGVIESQTRARIDELDKQKDALQEHLGDVTIQEQAALEELDRDTKIAGEALAKNLGAGIDGLPAQADLVGKEIKDVLENVKIQIPIGFNWSVPNQFPALPGPGEPGIPGAAGGVMAHQPGLVVFGEGGEHELGGPKSFFRDVLKSLGFSADGPGTAGRRESNPVTIHNSLVLDGRILDRRIVQLVRKRMAAGEILVPARAVRTRVR